MQDVLILEVVSPQAAAMGANRRKVMTQAGGGIGRRDGNAWVIPDKFISSQHATIRFLSGLYWIEALGRNPTALNDRGNVLRNNQPHPLCDGDRIFLDEYEITVRIGAQDAVAEPAPAADLLADAAAPAHYSQTEPQGGLLEGWGHSAPLVTPAAADGDILDLFPSDPTPAGIASVPSNAFAPTPLEQQALHVAPITPTPTPTPVSPVQNHGLSDDWFSEASAAPTPAPAQVAIPPVASRPVAPVAPAPTAAAVFPAHGAPVDSPMPSVRPMTQAAGQLPTLGDVLRGAGLDIQDEQISAEIAAEFGAALRIVIAGVMELLQARSAIKDQFRMRQTRFTPAGNNPLKLASNVEDALHTLLVKRDARFGYLNTPAAFEDAFDDLRHHQYAMLEGIKIATRSLLTRFDPAALGEEFERLTGRGGLLGGITGKSRFWELYTERYNELTRDPDESFRRLFGDDFGEAYEEQLEALKQAARQRPPGTSQ